LHTYKNNSKNHLAEVKRKKGKKKRKSEENKATAQLALKLRLAELMPDCWLEVSLHSEGPATGQMD
jgi:hypothetical protein